MEIKNKIRGEMIDGLVDYINTFRGLDSDSDCLRFIIYDNTGIELFNVKLNSLGLTGYYSDMIFRNINCDGEFIQDDNFFIGFVKADGLANRFVFRRFYNSANEDLITGTIGDHTANKNKDLIFNNLKPWKKDEVVKITSFIFNLPTGNNEYA